MQSEEAAAKEAELLAELDARRKHDESVFGRQWIISYPFNQVTPALSGIGVNTFDFKKGNEGITLYDGTIQSFPDTLQSLGFPYLKTLAIAVDTTATLQFYRKNQRTQAVLLDQFWALSGAILPFDKLTVTFPYPGAYLFVATTSEKEWRTVVLGSRVQRYSSGSTVDAFTAIQWQSVVTAAQLSNAGAAYTSSLLYVPNTGTKVVMIFNNDPLNSLDANLQGSVDGLQWVDDASTGAFISVGPLSNTALRVVNVPYQFMRLRLKSATAGSSAAYAVQFIGGTPGS